MRRALATALFACTGLMASADVKTCAVRLVIQPDSSAQGRVQVRIADARPGSFDLPFGIPEARDLRVQEGPPGTTAVLVGKGGQARIQFTLPEGSPPEGSLTVSFMVAQALSRKETTRGEGASSIRLLRHTFVNTREDVIEEYRFEALLAEGDRVQAIREALPRPGKAEAEPRVRLARLEGREAALLRAGPLSQGDDTAMTVELASTRRGWGWLLAGVALALLYLVRFRDLVAPPAGTAGSNHP